MSHPLHLYLADVDGWRVLVTPWPMVPNEGGLVEVRGEDLEREPYRRVVEDGVLFYRTAGPRAAVLLYDTAPHESTGPAMVGRF